MTPNELEQLPKPTEYTMTAMEIAIMTEIVERIKNAGEVTPLIDWTLSRLVTIGESKARMKKIINNALTDTDLRIDKIYEQAIQSDYVVNKGIYQAVGLDYLPYQENKWLQQAVEAMKAQTKDSLRPMENITQTTGFNVKLGKETVFTPLSEYLEQTLDKSMMEIISGVKTYSQAIDGAIDEMTSSGLRTMDYASGRSDRVEVAVRRAIMTGVGQLTDKVNEKNAKELNTDYWEVEWHMGARNTGTGFMNHQNWQGKVYNSEEMKTVCGLGEMLGFAGINCYHIRFPFIPGISKRKYTDEWLAEQNRKENTKRTFNGKEYDTYGAIQYQRKLERTIRKLKEDIKLLEKAKADSEDISATKIRLRVASKAYTDLSKEMDIPQQLERIRSTKTASKQ